MFPRRTLANIFKTFVRPLLDYGHHVLQHQVFNSSIPTKLEFIRRNASLAIRGLIAEHCETNTFRNSVWTRFNSNVSTEHFFFYKIITNKHPRYLISLMLLE